MHPSIFLISKWYVCPVFTLSSCNNSFDVKSPIILMIFGYNDFKCLGPLIEFVEVWFQVVNYLRFQVREMFKLTLQLTDYPMTLHPERSTL
jgi:hypothetical protein